MHTAQDKTAPKSACYKGPLVAGLLLFLAVISCAYWLYVVNTRETRETVDALREQSVQLVQLQEEKSLLEALLNKSPCEIRQWLQTTDKPAVVATEQRRAPETPPPAAPEQAGSGATLKQMEDATVFVLGQSGTSLMMGSGFFVAKDIVLTNRHVVARGPEALYVINGKLGALVSAALVAAGSTKQRDYALLRVTLPDSAAIRPLSFSTKAHRAQKVNVWGYPHAISKNDPKYQALISGRAETVPELSYADGVISAVLERNPPIIVHTAPLSPGNSGGPLADERGHILGINTMISLDEDSYRQTSLALHASDIILFLKENGINASVAE